MKPSVKIDFDKSEKQRQSEIRQAKRKAKRKSERQNKRRGRR